MSVHLARPEQAGREVGVVEAVPVVLGHQTEPAPPLVQLVLLPPQSGQEVGRVELQAGLVAPHLQPSPSLAVLQARHTAGGEDKTIISTHIRVLTNPEPR